MSFNKWMDKQTLVHPSKGRLVKSKKKWAIELQNYMEES